MTLHLFGLTGGIGSGKSTVADRFRATREVVEAGTEGLAAVVEAFGEGVLGPDGTLDRAALAAVVFGDDAKRRRLNAILHPRIAARTMERSAALEASGEPLACYEAALHVENGLADAFRPLVVVAVPEDVQVARAVARADELRAQMVDERAFDHHARVLGIVRLCRLCRWGRLRWLLGLAAARRAALGGICGSDHGELHTT